MKYAYTLIACTLVMMQASLYAEEGAAKRQREPKNEFSAEQREQFHMKLLDKNGDGKIDEQERAAGKAHHEEMLKKFDKNEDGKLDKTERQAMRDAWKAKKEAACDAAKADSVVEEPEVKAPDAEAKVKKDGAKKRGREGAGSGDRAPDPAVLKAFDKDGDGKLSKEERGAFRDARKAFDKDGDGSLSPKERKARHDSLAK